jgi:hypothetical protein
MDETREIIECPCGVAIQRRHYNRHTESKRHQAFAMQKVKRLRRQFGYENPLRGLLITLFHSFCKATEREDSSIYQTTPCRRSALAVAYVFQVSSDRVLAGLSDRLCRFAEDEHYQLEIGSQCQCGSRPLTCTHILEEIYIHLINEWMLSPETEKHYQSWKQTSAYYSPMLARVGWQYGPVREDQLNFALKRLQYTYDQQKRALQRMTRQVMRSSTDLPTDLIKIASEYIAPECWIPKCEKQTIAHNPRWKFIDG